MAAGGTPPVDDPAMWADPKELGGIPWVSISDMTAGPLVTSTARWVSSAGKKARRLPVGSVGMTLFAMYASVGETATLGCDATWNQAILGIQGNQGQADDRFIRYWLQHFRPRLAELTNSNTQDNLNAEIVGNIPFPSQGIDLQRYIADYLDVETARIDAIIDRRRRMLLFFEAKANASLDRWSSDLSHRFGTVALRRWVRTIEQGWSPVCDSVAADFDEWGLLKTSSVTSGRFIGTENKRLPDAVSVEVRWAVEDGDLLLARGSGSASNVGMAAVASTEGRRLLLSDLIYRVRLVSADPAFVARALRSGPCRSQFASAIRTDAGQTLKIRTDDIKEVRVPAVPFELQSAQARLVDAQIEASSRANPLVQQIALLLERRQALITAAVTGELAIG